MKPREANDTKAIQLSIKKMEQQPVTMVQFIQAVTNGGYKSWNVYKVSLSEILSIGHKGRSVPKKAVKPRYNHAFKIGLAYEREKTGLQFTPQLNFKECKTRNDKIMVINGADCSPQVKASLISALF